MRYGSTVQKQQSPYMYERFNVFYFFTSPLTFGNNTLLHINNAFIEALNRRDRLPRYILLILDRDLIDMVNRFDFGITEQLEKCVKWLATQLEWSITARKEQMWNIKLGAIPLKDTKIIWLEMFDRPVTDNAMTIRNKFNRGLNEVAKQRNNNYIMVIDSLKDPKHFERNGKLNYWGKLQFWKQVDYLVKQFDRRKTTLHPRSFTADANKDEEQCRRRHEDYRKY